MTEKYWDGQNWLIVKKNNFSISYYFNGDYHRNDGPANIFYFDNKNVSSKYYYKDGKLHRENGPAIIHYFSNGSILCKKYLFNEKRHRKNGPALFEYYKNGSIKIKEYWFNNNKFDPENLPFELPIDTEEKIFMFNLKCNDNNV